METVRWTVSAVASVWIKEKEPSISLTLLCWHYLFSQVGQGIVLPSASVQWTLAGRKKPRLFSRGFCVRVTYFPGRPKYRHGVGTVRWTVPAVIYELYKVKDHNFRCGLLCSRYLFSQAVTRQVSSAPMSLTSVFGMGTGGPSSQSTRTLADGF